MHPKSTPDPARLPNWLPAEHVDPPIRRLVALLNRLPGCETVGSCGGHEAPSHYTQQPAHRWSVSVGFLEGRRPWESLRALTWLVQEMRGVRLTLWVDSDPESDQPNGGIRIDLDGSHRALPRLEAALLAYIQQQRRKA